MKQIFHLIDFILLFNSNRMKKPDTVAVVNVVMIHYSIYYYNKFCFHLSNNHHKINY